MKRLVLFLALLVLIAGIVQEASGQTVIRRVTVFANKHLSNSGRDSTISIPLEYSGPITACRGQFPDSIHLSWAAVATGDSIKTDLYQYTKDVSSTWNRSSSIVDSVKADETDYITLTRSTYFLATEIGILSIARSAGNAAVSATSRIWCNLDLFYTKPSP